MKNISYVDLIAWYPFTGNAADSSGYKHNGTVHGAKLVSVNQTGTDQAYSFNGINNYIEIPDMPQQQQFSVTAWYKTTNTSGTIYSMTYAGYLGVNSTDITNPAKTVASVENPGGNYSTLVDTAVITDDKWHFAVLTVSNDTIKLYVDNRLTQTKPVNGRIDYNNSGALIGVYDVNMTLYFNGLIDDVRLYKSAIDRDMVSLLYADKVKTCVNDPVIVDAGSDLTICKGISVTLNATGNAVSYTWDNNVTNGVPFAATTSGDYTVTATAANGCKATDEVHITVQECTGINNTSGRSLKIYPNPAGNNLTIGSDRAIAKISIQSLSGIEVLNIAGETENISLKQLPAGIYILKIYFRDNTTETIKLIKK